MAKPKPSRSKPSPVRDAVDTLFAPRWILRAEGLAALVASVAAYSLTGRGWSLFLMAFLIPDLGLLGYFKDRRVGAWAYNITHNTILPLAWGLCLWRQAGPAHPDLWMPAMWLAHVGWDRMIGYGLKYHPDFKTTHLQKI